MVVKKLSISVFLMLVFLTQVYSQEQYRFSVEPKIHYGYIALHSPKMYPIADRHFAMGELTFNVIPCGKKTWNYAYKKGIWGFSYLYSNFGGNPYLGSLNAALLHFNFPLSRNPKNHLYLRLGSGFGYIQKVYSRVDNSRNAALGSHLNMSMNIIFEYRIQLSKNMSFVSLMGLNHFSNAAFQKPNLGINIFTASAGLAYRFKKVKTEKLDTLAIYSAKPPFKKYTHNVNVAFAINEATQPYGPKYVAYIATYTFFKRLNAKVKIGAGAEYNYNTLYSKKFTNNYFQNVSRLGFTFQQETLIDRFAVGLTLGTYAYSKVHEVGQEIFTRLSLRYYLKNNMIVGLSLKTHYATAEFVDVGIGYKF